MDLNENERLIRSQKNHNWKKWGPYISNANGQHKEDYSPEGNTWFVNHDLPQLCLPPAKMPCRILRQRPGLCIAPAFWNGNPILKERLSAYHEAIMEKM